MCFAIFSRLGGNRNGLIWPHFSEFAITITVSIYYREISFRIAYAFLLVIFRKGGNRNGLLGSHFW